jgi:hypothetical protein
LKSLPADVCHRYDIAGQCSPPRNRPSCPGRRGRGEQLVLSLQALETVPAPRFERQPGGAFGEVAGRARQEDLAGSGLVQDAGRGVYRHAPNLVVAHDHFAAVDADPLILDDEYRGLIEGTREEALARRGREE